MRGRPDRRSRDAGGRGCRRRRGASAVGVAVVCGLALAPGGLGTGAAPAGATPSLGTQTPERIEVPESIDPTGATDVSAALSELLALAPESAIVELRDDATYRVDAGIDLRRIGSLTIEGNGATLVADDDGAAAEPPSRAQRGRWPRDRRILTLAGVDHVTIRDLTIDGPNDEARYEPSLEGQSAFHVVRSDFVMLDGVTVREVWGDGVYVAGGSHGVVVVNSTFERIGRQGVAVVQGTDVQITANRFDDVARSVIDVEPTRNAEVRDVDIRDNEIGDYGNFVLAAAGGGPNVGAVTLADNTITGGRGLSVYAGIARHERRGLTISGNRSEVDGTAAIGDAPIQITNVRDLVIERNTAPVPDGAVVIALNSVCEPVIRDNVWPGADDPVVELAPCGSAPVAPPTSPTTASGPGSTDTTSTDTTSTDTTSIDDGTIAARDGSDEDLPAWAALAIGLVLGALAALAAVAARRRR